MYGQYPTYILDASVPQVFGVNLCADTRKLDKLVKERESVRTKLESAQIAVVRQRRKKGPAAPAPTVRTGFLGMWGPRVWGE